MDLNDVVDALKSIESSSRSSMAENIIDSHAMPFLNGLNIKRQREKWSGTFSLGGGNIVSVKGAA